MGLFEVIHPGVPLPQQHFTKLIQQRCRGRRDGPLADGHAQHGLVTALLELETGCIRAQQFQKRNPVDARHFPWIRRQVPGGTPPDHHWRHHESGTGGKIIQPAQDGVRAERKPDLLFELPQRALFRGLTGIETSPGQCPLASMTAQVFGATGENQGRLRPPDLMHGKTFEISTEALLHHGQGHGGMQTFVDQVLTRFEALETPAKQRPQF